MDFFLFRLNKKTKISEQFQSHFILKLVHKWKEITKNSSAGSCFTFSQKYKGKNIRFNFPFLYIKTSLLILKVIFTVSEKPKKVTKTQTSVFLNHNQNAQGFLLSIPLVF